MNTIEPRYGNLAAHNATVPANPDFLWASTTLLVALITFDVAAVKASGFSVPIADNWQPFAFNLICVGILCVINNIKRYAAVCKAAYIERWIVALLGLACMRVFLAASTILQSLCVAVDAPLVDDVLINLDHRIGFSWDHLAVWYSSQHRLATLSGYLYILWGPQVIFTLFVLPLANRYRDLSEFIFVFFSISLVSLAVSAFLPASNPYFHYGMATHYGPSPWSQFYPLREGTLRSVDLTLTQGLVSFPSMHAAGALVFVYAARHIRWLFAISIVINFLMTLVALYIGAHYLADIIAGLLLSCGVIRLARWIDRRTMLARY